MAENQEPRTKNQEPRSGFSLVELLVVIAIIGILSALLIPAVWQAVVRARQTRIVLEVSQLHDSVERYRQTRGAYPPDAFGSPRIDQHLRKAFPRHDEGTATSGGPLQTLIDAQLTPAEALVFWLSQVVNDPRKPLSSGGDPDVIFPFVESRLRPRLDPVTGLPQPIMLGAREIFLYEYFPPGTDRAPYVYFAAPYTVPHPSDDTTIVDHFVYDGFPLYPYRSFRGLEAANTPAALEALLKQLPTSNQWLNETTFQIIAPGLDGEFGYDTVQYATPGIAPASGVSPGPGYKVYPNGLNYTEGDWDNIANFTDGRTFQDSIE